MNGAFSIPVRVYIEDTDAGGIVYYVNYLKYMERARTELLRSLGYDKPAMPQQGLLLVVHSAEIRYRCSARLDDALRTTAAIGKLGRAAVTFEQKIWRQNELICEGVVKVACVSDHNHKPCALPGPIFSALKAVI
ncbi:MULTISPECIES: tol-pal system-associated acyl-CoA thioesterase [unclassified Microbulbifer]|uniref:Tol-pal system-associated acyl-CoA thioesterase n=1 Tax=Microbulbifer spongiae TaxID=2944933 RepID=A0ABY9EAG4_9GAMM|nr:MULTISPECIES: tol-pal system-associated acyl-CoA thioesterase [unclassified Microbulbifer]MDP5210724.1 tol-pal system-associated acyl-CoA thioesterase [Microbulbifer sp. 2205BS26-8]WKD49147.1 tol-pal system-associated acyl-CoA thioesterase [Microbulbifer sp. MI-G]